VPIDEEWSALVALPKNQPHTTESFPDLSEFQDPDSLFKDPKVYSFRFKDSALTVTDPIIAERSRKVSSPLIVFPLIDFPINRKISLIEIF